MPQFERFGAGDAISGVDAGDQTEAGGERSAGMRLVSQSRDAEQQEQQLLQDDGSAEPANSDAPVDDDQAPATSTSSTMPSPSTTTTTTTTTTTSTKAPEPSANGDADDENRVRSRGARSEAGSSPMVLNEELIDKLMSNKTLVALMSGQLRRVADTDAMSEADKQRLVRQVFEQMMDKRVDFSSSNVRLAVKTVSSSYRALAAARRRQSADGFGERLAGGEAAGADVEKERQQRRDRKRRQKATTAHALDAALKLSAGSGDGPRRDASGKPIVVVVLPQERARARAKAAAAR